MRLGMTMQNAAWTIAEGNPLGQALALIRRRKTSDEQAHIELCTAIALYRAMEMTVCLPQAQAEVA
jgi:hypothetical protein